MSEPTTLEPIQYIVSETGERTGVVLTWKTYTELKTDTGHDPDLLDNLSLREVHALAEGMLAAGHQERLHELLERNAIDKLDEGENQELDDRLADVDALNILKARALFTLRQRATSAP